MNLENAIAAAADIHQGQQDLAGEPYILHPLRVMLAGRTEEERILGVLHDAVEDGGWKVLEGALLEPPPPWLRVALDAISRREGETYEAFIARCAEHPLARRVKLADLKDNLMPERQPAAPSEKDLRRRSRYERALKFLGALEGGDQP